MRFFYFGCHRESGHFFWDEAMRHAWDAERVIPWERVDGALCPGASQDPDRWWERTRPEVEGEAALHHKDGWTALAFWDRSVDHRSACNSVFFAEGTHSFAEMVQIAGAHFPQVWGRFAFTVRLAESEVATR
jgi:hypothetical protein